MPQKPTAVIKSFSGGWNCDADPLTLKPNEFVCADNIDLLPNDGFETRKGITSPYEIDYPGKVLQIEKWPQINGTVILLGVYQLVDALYLVKIGASGGALTTLCTLASANVSFEFYSEYVFFVDGASYRYYDGTAVYNVKPDAPGTSPTVTSASGGASSSGTYAYAVTFVNDTGTESKPCVLKTITVSSGQKFNWTDLPFGGPNIKARKLYRSKAYNSSNYSSGDPNLYGDGNDALYYVTTIQDNTTGTYIDNVADVDLTTRYDDNSDIEPITRCKYLLRHPKSARFFAAGDSLHPGRLYWGGIDKPGYWGKYDYYEPLTGGGPMLGLDVFADGVLAMFASGFYAWQGTDPGSMSDASNPGNVTWSRLPVDHGIICAKAACRTPGTYSFLSLGGIWALNSMIYSDVNISLVETSATAQNLTKNKVLKEINAITNPSLCRMIWDVPRQRLLLAYTTQSGTVEAADKILVYHWGIGGGFTRYTGLTVYDFCLLDSGELYISSGNRIYQMYSGDDDAGTAIATAVETAFFDFDLPLVRKKLCKVFLTAASGSNTNSKIDLQVTNGNKIVTLNSIALYSNSEVWSGEFSWDATTTWPKISRKILNKERVLQGILEGSSFQLKIFHSSPGERIKVFSIGMQFKKYTAKGERG